MPGIVAYIINKVMEYPLCKFLHHLILKYTYYRYFSISRDFWTEFGYFTPKNGLCIISQKSTKLFICQDTPNKKKRRVICFYQKIPTTVKNAT